MMWPLQKSSRAALSVCSLFQPHWLIGFLKMPSSFQPFLECSSLYPLLVPFSAVLSLNIVFLICQGTVCGMTILRIKSCKRNNLAKLASIARCTLPLCFLCRISRLFVNPVLLVCLCIACSATRLQALEFKESTSLTHYLVPNTILDT